MGTEDELRERVRLTVRKVRYVVGQRRQPSTAVIVDAAFAALGIPLPVLAWIVANPEAAKGLASGGMVAVPAVPTEAMCDAGWIDKEDVSPREIWGAMLDAASPAPSGKAQGETT